MIKSLLVGSSLQNGFRQAQSRKLISLSSSQMASIFKGNFFGRKTTATVPEVVLPEDLKEAKAKKTANFVDDAKLKTPSSTVLKAQIREMERTEEAGNLYSTFKPTRMTIRERDENLEERFLHPDLAANDRVKI